MYFKQRGETNIDEELAINSREIKSKKTMKIAFIVIGIIAIIGIILLLIFLIGNRITLKGSKELTIYEGTSYIEPGYTAKSMFNKDRTNEVSVTGTVDSNVIGTYTIKYKYGISTAKREVTVVPRPAVSTVIILSGNDPLYFNVGDTYYEPGFKAIDAIDGDLTDKVEVTNEVDMSKEGAYRVLYSVVNSSGNKTSKERSVIIK